MIQNHAAKVLRQPLRQQTVAEDVAEDVAERVADGHRVRQQFCGLPASARHPETNPRANALLSSKDAVGLRALGLKPASLLLNSPCPAPTARCERSRDIPVGTGRTQGRAESAPSARLNSFRPALRRVPRGTPGIATRCRSFSSLRSSQCPESRALRCLDGQRLQSRWGAPYGSHTLGRVCDLAGTGTMSALGRPLFLLSCRTNTVSPVLGHLRTISRWGGRIVLQNPATRNLICSHGPAHVATTKAACWLRALASNAVSFCLSKAWFGLRALTRLNPYTATDFMQHITITKHEGSTFLCHC
jgi:hypothetical protein